MLKQRIHDVFKVFRLDHVEYFLELIEKHDLLEAARLGPILEQALHDRLSQRGVLLDELHHAVGQLRMKRLQRVRLVHGYEDALQKLLVLLLERYGEAVYDAAQYLEQLGDAVKLLILVHEPQEYVVDLLANVGAQAQELAVNSMQYCFEEIAFARVLAVKQIEHL